MALGDDGDHVDGRQPSDETMKRAGPACSRDRVVPRLRSRVTKVEGPWTIVPSQSSVRLKRHQLAARATLCVSRMMCGSTRTSFAIIIGIAGRRRRAAPGLM